MQLKFIAEDAKHRILWSNKVSLFNVKFLIMT